MAKKPAAKATAVAAPTSPSTPKHSSFDFSKVFAAIAPSIPVLMQTAESDFGPGNGKTKMQRVLDSLMTALQIGAPMVLANNPQHADAIKAGAQAIFNVATAANTLFPSPTPKP